MNLLLSAGTATSFKISFHGVQFDHTN